MTTRNIKTLETNLRLAVTRVLNAQKALSNARDNAGIYEDPRLIYTDGEVSSIRREIYGEMKAVIIGMATPSGSAFAKLAELRGAEPEIAKLFSNTSPRKKGNRK